MTATSTTQIAAFTIDAPADLIQLAAPIVANHLAISKADAEAQLRQGRVQTADQGAAARLLPLLRALGLSPEVVTEQPKSVALQVGTVAEALRIAPLLARALDKDCVAVLAALQRPGGLVLDDLTAARANALRQDLRRLKGLRVTLAAGPSDLFAIAPIDPTTSRALSRHLAALGLVPCRFGGAVAAGLTTLQVTQLRSRFDCENLLAVNRAFQRFDLFLTGTKGLPAADVAAFLSTRADLSGAMVEAVTPLQPLQIERGLTRASAIQFRADYAAIGLETHARLAWV